jgi:hypothetical protein
MKKLLTLLLSFSLVLAFAACTADEVMPEIPPAAEDEPQNEPDPEQSAGTPKDESNYRQLNLAEQTNTLISAQDIFSEMERSLSPDEIEDTYGVKYFGSSFGMNSTYSLAFATEEYLITVISDSATIVNPSDETYIRSWAESNTKNTVFGITEEDLDSGRFQYFLALNIIGIFNGATAADFYNDPVIKRITEYLTPEGEYVLKKDGVVISEGDLEQGMTFELAEENPNDGIILFLIGFVEFN